MQHKKNDAEPSDQHVAFIYKQACSVTQSAPLKEEYWRVKLPFVTDHRFLSPTLHCGIKKREAVEFLRFHTLAHAMDYLKQRDIKCIALDN